MILVTEHTHKDIKDYKDLAAKKSYDNIKKLADNLKKKKIMYINATPQGGGVAEILKTLIPLQKSLGLETEWYYMEPDPTLFGITKKIHNSLQGSEDVLTAEEKDYYVKYNKEMARGIQDMKPDILMIQDPQPLAAIDYLKDIPSAARVHIDSTSPNPDTANFVFSFLNKYQKIIFSLEDFVPADADKNKLIISPPAIDPLSVKNSPLETGSVRKILIGAGIQPDKPLMTQISRFDKWKDPLGVIDAYYKVKNEVPNVQLALVGVIEASDDPEAIAVFNEVNKKAEGDPDIYLISSPEQREQATGEASAGVFENAIVQASDVVLQKSIREGFGLTVTEAMWKAKPVIGGNTGGIRIQIKDGVTGYLVDSPDEAAEKSLEILNNPKKAQKMGEKAKESVRENFLITRYLEDELKIMNSLL